MDTLVTIATYASFVIAGLIVILNGIAPLTKSDLDNKILDGLRWFEDTVLKVLLPAQTPKAPVDPSDKK